MFDFRKKGREMLRKKNKKDEDKNINQLLAIKLNDKLAEFLDVVFEADGYWLNLDKSTLKILVPVPWSSKNYQIYQNAAQITRKEADLLKEIIKNRLKDQNPLFVYDGKTRSWHIGYKYRRVGLAFMYLARNPIDHNEISNYR